MNLEELINRSYDAFTPNDRQVVSYILANKGFIAGATSQEAADGCHVSRATLLRVCKKMGLQNFAELKYLLKYQDGAGERQASADMEAIIDHYHGLIDDLKKADYGRICRLIYGAERIFIYGTGNEQKAVAEEFKRIFLMFGKCIVDLFDYGEVEFAAKSFSSDDLFLIISLSGETPEGIRILRMIEYTGIHMVSLTRWKNNTIAGLCEHNLYAGTRVLTGYRDMSYEIMAAFYILLDVLSVHYLVYERERRHEAGTSAESELCENE